MKRNIQWLSVLLALVMIVSVFTSCANHNTAASENPTEATQEGTTAAGEPVNVQILATSDLHGWFVPHDFAIDKDSTKGSLTYLATLIKQHRADNENVVLVDCGDSVQANYVEYFIDAELNPMMDAFNYLGYDVWTFGNHEYNFTKAQRDHLVEQFNGVTLSGNVYLKGEDHSYLPATTVVERGGVKIGIVGMTTPMITEFEKGKTSLDEVDVYNPIDVTRKAIDELKAQNVDCIVGLMHEGLYQENGVYGTSITDIADEFPEFDVIIGGHAHKEVESQYQGDVLLCEPYYYGRVLSVVDLAFEKTEDGYRLTDKAATIEPCGDVEDEGLVALMAPYQAELSGYVNTPIGTLVGSDLSKDSGIPGISGVYTSASGIMNLLGTAAIYYSGADCIFLCTDYEDAGFPVGEVSIKNISSSYSFSGGEASVYEATGRQVKKILEWSVGYFNTMKDGDLIVSYDPERRASKYSSDFFGLGLCYDVDLTKEAGERIQNLGLIVKDAQGMPLYNADGSIQTVPITDDTPIKLGANSYYIDQWQSEGGCLEGEGLVPSYSSFEEYGDDGTIRALAITYIKEVLNGTIDGDQFNYENWKLLTGVDPDSADYQKAVALLTDGTLALYTDENGRTNIKSISVSDIG